jgi:hypothetical protein
MKCHIPQTTAILFFSVILLTACSGGYFGRKKLGEKIFTSHDITVSWYRVSEITTMHDFVDITRWGHTKNIMEANPNGIYNIVISADTVIIQATRDLLVYDLAARTLQCFIKLDQPAQH